MQQTIIRKQTNLGCYIVRQVINIKQKKQRSKDCSLRDSWFDSGGWRHLSVDHNALGTIPHKSSNLRPCLAIDTVMHELLQEPLVRYDIEGLRKIKDRYINLLFWSYLSMRSCIVVMSWDSQECLLRKPYCRDVRILCLFKCLWIWEQSMCSRILQHTQVNDIGR